MRRLLRWAFNAAAAVSALLCVATCVLWVQSYRAGWLVNWSRPRTEFQAGAAKGQMWAYGASEPPGVFRGTLGFGTERFAPPTDPRKWGYGPREIPYHFDVAGFAAGSGPYATVPGRSADVVIVPCWAVTLAMLLPPMLMLLRVRRKRKRLGENLCPACGYDLRATPDRCPECGTVPKAKGAT
jgi:hypothetical protein